MHSEEEETLRDVKRMIAVLEPEERTTVGIVANRLRADIERHGRLGDLALALVGAEAAAKAGK